MNNEVDIQQLVELNTDLEMKLIAIQKVCHNAEGYAW